MMLKNPVKLGSSVAIFIILFSSSFLAFSSVSVSKVCAQDTEYDYYGYVPAKIYDYNLTDANNVTSGWRLDTGSIAKAGLVAITGIEDDTHVEVYRLDNGSLVSEATIGSMEKYYVVFKNGTFFRVVTNKLASVLLLNYESIPLDYGSLTSYPLPFTFYYDVNGAYVGKEFILMAVQFDIYLQYTIFALEKAEVTVTREDGDIQPYSIEANAWKRLIWEPFRTYKIESTGNIMIHAGNIDTTTFFVPCTEGGFVGKTFFTLSRNDWDTRESYGFRVSAAQDAKITVWNLETKQQILTADVQAGSGFGFKPQAPAIVVQSDQPVTLEYVHNGSLENIDGAGMYSAYGSGVAYIGVKPGEDTPFYLPVDSYVEAYIFASEETDISLDGNDWTIRANSYYLITQPGTHIMRGNRKLVIEVLNWPFEPEYQGLQYEGVQIPSIQAVDVVPDVSLTPLGESFPITYVVIGVAATAIGGLAVLQFFRGRRKK